MIIQVAVALAGRPCNEKMKLSNVVTCLMLLRGCPGCPKLIEDISIIITTRAFGKFVANTLLASSSKSTARRSLPMRHRDRSKLAQFQGQSSASLNKSADRMTVAAASKSGRVWS